MLHLPFVYYQPFTCKEFKMMNRYWMISLNSATNPSSHVTPNKGRRAATLFISLLWRKNAMNYGLSLKGGTGNRQDGEYGERGTNFPSPKFPHFKDSCFWRFPIWKIPRFKDSPFSIASFPIRRSFLRIRSSYSFILKIAMHDLREKSWITPPLFKWPFEVQTNDISLSVLRKDKGQILFTIAISAKGNSL